MKSAYSDPIVLICCGVILVGIIGLLWAISKFRALSRATSVGNGFDDILPPSNDLRNFELNVPPVRNTPMVPTTTPAVSRDVADRLDSMSQRLSEMQTLLSKQTVTTGDAAFAGGTMGQGFSPETIDKLMKIIGNVVQQVDILQKSLNPAREGVAKAESSTATIIKP